MNPQQPGQTFQPGGDQTNDSATPPTQTSDEIAAIDSAVQQTPPQADSEQPVAPGPAETNTQEQPVSTAEPVQEVEQPAVEQTYTEPMPQADSNPRPNSMPPQPQVAANQEVPAPSDYSESIDSTTGQELPNQEPAIEESLDDGPLLSWQAAEPAPVQKQVFKAFTLVVFIGLLIIGGLIILDGINFGTVLSGVAMVSGLGAVYYMNRQHNQIQEYAIYKPGIEVGGQFYGFSEIKSFSVTREASGIIVELEPVGRFMMRIVVHLDASTTEQVIELLESAIPREDREPGFLDRFSDSLKM